MADVLFPSAPKLPDTQEVDTIFPSIEDVSKPTSPAELSDVYVADLAERWSMKTLTPYGDMYNIIKNVGPDGVLKQPTSNDASLAVGADVINYGYQHNLSAEDLKVLYEEKSNYQQFQNAAKANKDVLDSVAASSASFKDLTYEQKQAYIATQVRDKLNKEFGNTSFMGSVMDFFGMLGREMTWGVGENISGYKGKTAQYYFDLVNTAKTPEEVNAGIDAMLAEGKSRGLFNSNSINTYFASDAFLSGGTSVNEGPQALLDIATFAIPGLVKGAKSLASMSRVSGLFTARDAVDLIANSSTVAAADEFLTHAMTNNTGSVQFLRHTSSASNRIGIPNPLSIVSPSAQPTLVFENTNAILRHMKNSNWGSGLDEVALQARAEEEARNFAKHSNLSYMNHVTSDYAEGSTGKMVKYLLGKDTGGAFTTKSSAEKVAKQLSGEVIEITPGKEWQVAVTKSLSTKNLSSVTEETELADGFFKRLFSPFLSAEVTGKQANQTLLKQGEARTNYMMGVLKPYRKAMSKISGPFWKKERENLDTFITEMGSSGRDRAYDPTEFERAWFTRFGSKPDPKVAEAYAQSMYMNETRWFLHADVERNRLVDAGVEVVHFNKRGELKVIPDSTVHVNRSSNVLDLTTGEVKKALDFQAEGKTLYTLSEDLNENGRVIRYVTGEVTHTRPINHFDSLAFNPGGMREAKFKYFIRQNTRGIDLDGNEVGVMPRLLYASGSEKSAQEALNQINKILEKVRGLTSNADLDTFKAFRSHVPQTTIDEVNAVIRANNGFNPSIENLDDFIKMSEETGLDWSSPMKVSHADEKVGDVGGLNNKLITPNSSTGDIYRYQHNTYGDRFKTVTPYGYQENIIPITRVIERDYARQLNTKGQAEYLKASIEGLVSGAIKNNVLKNAKSIQNAPIFNQIRELEIDTSTTIGKKFDAVRKNILRKVNEKSEFAKNWEYTINALQEKIFDKGFFGTGIGKNKQWTIFDKFSKDPIVSLRGWAFDMKLGLFAIDQVIVQSSQIANIIAIAPKYGTQALAELPALRIALADGRAAVIGEVGKRLGRAASSLDAKSFEDMVYYIKKSGRTNIGGNISELDSMESIGFGMVDRIRKLGRGFFNEGELLTRLTASSTAFREWRVANPTTDIMTKEGFAAADSFITARADALTAHMTSASSAAWQKGILSLGTQFYGYNARVLEQLFFGTTLTKKERIRLGLSQLLMYGATGTGFGWTVDKFMDTTDTSMDKSVYTMTKYGLVDYLVSTITGADTAYSTRLSMGSAIIETYQKIADQSFAETFFGPVGSIVGDATYSSMKALYTLATGYPTGAKMDFKKFMMNISGFSKPAQAWAMANTGEYRTKDGRLRAEGLSKADAAAYLAGAPLQVIQSQYDAMAMKQSEDEFIKEMATRIKELSRQATLYHTEGKDAEAQDLWNQIGDLYRGTTPYQKGRIMAFNKESFSSSAVSIMMEMQKRGHNGQFKVMQQLNMNEENK